MSNYTLKDIEDLEELMNAITEIKQDALENSKEPTYPISVKKETVRLKFQLGVTSRNMDNELGLQYPSTDTWTAKYKNSGHASGQLYGETVRYDVPTKCLIVKQHIEDGIPGHVLAREYNVSQPTIAHWKSQYKNDYDRLIDAPERTMIIGKEDKCIVGLANIKKIMLVQEYSARISKESVETLGSFHKDPEPVSEAINQLETLADSFNQD